MTNFDLSIVTYAAIILVSLYGFGLFGWWWNKIGKASEVYVYMMMMFLATAFKAWTSLMGRIAFYEGPDAHTAYVTSALWDVRAFPVLIVLLLIVIRMTQRACLSVTGEMTEDPDKE